MKKIALIVALIGSVAFGNTVFGQDERRDNPKEHSQKTPAEKAANRTAKMKKELELTADQTSKVEAINLKHAEEMDALHAEIKKLKEEARALREAHKTELNTVLTPEQQKIMEEKMAEKKRKRDERKRGHHPHPPAPADR